MPTIKVSDQFGFDIDVIPAPPSALLQYFKSLPNFIVQKTKLSEIAGATLDKPAVVSLSAGLGFSEPVSLGVGGPELTIGGGVHGSFRLVARRPAATGLFRPDLFGDDIEIPEDSCYMGVQLEASTSVSADTPPGVLSFGVEPGAAITFANYRLFPQNKGVTLASALSKTIGGFVIPARAKDLAEIPPFGVATVTGTGSLKLSATADLFAATNPLLTAPLPGALPAPSIKAGGSVAATASYEIAGEYQVRASCQDARTVRVGWFRSKSTEFSVSVSASEGIRAGIGDKDLLGSLLHAISRDPQADHDELAAAGVGEGGIASIRSAVAAAVARKLEVAITAELGALHEGDAAFLYDVDPAGLSSESEAALNAALAGDLSALHAPEPLPGITPVRSILTNLQQRTLTLNVNLLGIFNFISVGKLISSGTVMVEPVTGALLITDEQTATRVRSGQVNFGADADKVRHLLAETFLVTAAYKGTVQSIGDFSLSCSHTFFKLEDRTSPGQMRGFLQVALALGLLPGNDASLPAGATQFGRSMVHAETSYDDKLSEALFLDAANQPVGKEVYETAGREAIQLLIREDAPDAVRRRPATDDDLWATMKDRGQANFKALFPGIEAPLLGAITADYSAIMWWTEAMSGTAVRLAALKQLLAEHPGLSPDDAKFAARRKDLAAHLKDVTSRTAEEFGQPWGLVAMYQASGRKAAASVIVSSPKFGLVQSAPRPALARAATEKASEA